ncbi:putative membrane protein YesL [Neobacillus bataviensis]|uniref:Putative membrane protein YesL n=1 Tax=Neobacillus bataviensis TaxID=220685 RepID=A0A561CR90_9BACI|nr:YesL family protein [Neobacillus bataviensis]TWD93741.1 putative membrane protein YesL [Neobacillus bataviensis]
MQMKGAIGGFYKLCDWIMKLAFINLLWMVFSIFGLVVFSFFPATIAMFVVIRKMLMGDFDIPVFKTFLESFKKDFFKSNLLGLILFILGYFLYVDIHLIRTTGGLLNLIYYPALIICLGFVLTVCYAFPTFVHYDFKVHQVLKSSFIIMLLNPLSTILIVIGGSAVYLLMTTVPGLIPLFSGSTLAVVIMWSSFFAFSRIERAERAALGISDTAVVKRNK